MDDRTAKVVAHWSQNLGVKRPGESRTQWWEFDIICRHINKRICGVESSGTLGGDLELLKILSKGRPFQRAISVGCGIAGHEIGLLSSGIVERFDLYEISPARADKARLRARQAQVGDRANVVESDAFVEENIGQYDLVYWKDSLHHMFDAADAVAWSKRFLKVGGVFYMNDFVGPTRMQYTARQLEMAAKVRGALPAWCLAHPTDPALTLPVRRMAPLLKHMLAADPSECADSERIMPAVQVFFPEATIVPAGGLVYMLALGGILANMDEQRDVDLFRAMLLADDLCAEAGESLYAVAHATKTAAA